MRVATVKVKTNGIVIDVIAVAYLKKLDELSYYLALFYCSILL